MAAAPPAPAEISFTSEIRKLVVPFSFSIPALFSCLSRSARGVGDEY